MTSTGAVQLMAKQEDVGQPSQWDLRTRAGNGMPDAASTSRPRSIAEVVGVAQTKRLRPPSTMMRWPVTNPAPSEARKLTTWAMSSGVPIRAMGTDAR